MIGKTLSHYKVIEKIGQGGMGEVYPAKDTNPSREVAIFVILMLSVAFFGCTVRKTRVLDPVEVQQPEKERIVAITDVTGVHVSFDPPGASVRDDKIYASVNAVPYELPLNQVQRFWVVREELSTKRTIGLVAAVAAGAVIVAIATTRDEKEPEPPPQPTVSVSCPFVYSWDGTQYVFDAEPYGGAITRGLERDDYSELEHLRAEKGLYRLLLTNEVPETQFTNLMELQVVDHPAGIRVIADEWGKLHTLSAPRRLMSARDRTGRDLLPWLEETDQLIWEAEAVPDVNGNVRHEIVMTFPKPEEAAYAKLVANVATGLWGSYMLKSILELQGHGLEDWYALIDNNKKEADTLLAWNLQEELYALKVYVEEPTGWELRGILPGGGPYISEERVVLLDLSRVLGDQLRIRIHPPAGFWALNSFSVDYSTDKPLWVEIVRPLSAVDDSEQGVRGELLVTDDSYYAMPLTGNRAYISFRVPAPHPGMKRTVFLHSRGYYRYHLTGKGEPKTAILQQIFDVPDTMARIAATRFNSWRSAR